MSLFKTRTHGFTLIELLIVVAIIGILAAIAIPQYGKYRVNAAIGSLEADMRTCMSEAFAEWSAGNLENGYDCVAENILDVDAGTAGFTFDAEGDPSLEFEGITAYGGVSNLSVDCDIEEGRRISCFEDDEV